jgi:glutamine cyclotransferase
MNRRSYTASVLLLLICSWLSLVSCTTRSEADKDVTPTNPLPLPTHMDVFSHDPNASTQGLVFEDGQLYEGTGLRGRSTLRKVDLESGEILRLFALPPQLYGEGVTTYGNKIYQLTWQSHVGLVYDRESFERLHAFYYPTEGWGLTHDGTRLIMSDGTAALYFLDPETLEKTGQLQVRVNDGPATRSSLPDSCFPSGKRTAVNVYYEPAIGLNELEYIQGEIYANVWQTDCIARIDPETGQSTASPTMPKTSVCS